MKIRQQNQISTKIKTSKFTETIDESLKQTLEDLDNFYHSQKEVNRRQMQRLGL